MAMPLPRSLVEHMLLGPYDDRRQLQDSPILGDVWVAFAEAPEKPQDLLITPLHGSSAAKVAVTIDERIGRSDDPDDDPNIACLSNLIAARLYFPELLHTVVPMTQWWESDRCKREFGAFMDPKDGAERLRRTVAAALRITEALARPGRPREQALASAFDRYVALSGLLLWAAGDRKPRSKPESDSAEARFAATLGPGSGRVIERALRDVLARIGRPEDEKASVYQVSRNRSASPAIFRSVPAVKADAASRLFEVSCRDVTWAVLDSGIDLSHPAFAGRDGRCRVRKVLDFTHFRTVVSIGNAKPRIRRRNVEKLAEARAGEGTGGDSAPSPLPDDAEEILADLAEDARKGRPFDWERAERLIIIEQPPRPSSDHGTHVAGIIGANCRPRDGQKAGDECADGMCPDINLYDFRVLGADLAETEFAIISALQYIRHINERDRSITVHGANLSLQIPHDVRNYACGRTPVCVECERLVSSGVVVVAAAGNLGYHSYETRAGSYEGYAALSLTDPGNADAVITVGSTHRYSPHSYGVSFFSSRGPTGDGRPKPDLVAPGERIHSPVRGGHWGDLDGTSMAAPHVSGAAAMLMARYSELIGEPRRIKQILCDSATDLGRERAFQGNGMLDVLRAFQSI